MMDEKLNHVTAVIYLLGQPNKASGEHVIFSNRNEN